MKKILPIFPMIALLGLSHSAFATAQSPEGAFCDLQYDSFSKFSPCKFTGGLWDESKVELNTDGRWTTGAFTSISSNSCVNCCVVAGRDLPDINPGAPLGGKITFSVSGTFSGGIEMSRGGEVGGDIKAVEGKITADNKAHGNLDGTVSGSVEIAYTDDYSRVKDFPKKTPDLPVNPGKKYFMRYGFPTCMVDIFVAAQGCYNGSTPFTKFDYRVNSPSSGVPIKSFYFVDSTVNCGTKK